MHELSIAMSIVETVEENLPSENIKVLKVNLKIGKLSGVAKEALIFSFEIAANDSQLENAVLEIEELSIKVFCEKCQKESILANLPIFRCEYCSEPTANILQGKELEIVSVVLEDDTNT